MQHLKIHFSRIECLYDDATVMVSVKVPAVCKQHQFIDAHIMYMTDTFAIESDGKRDSRSCLDSSDVEALFLRMADKVANYVKARIDAPKIEFLSVSPKTAHYVIFD